MINRLYPLLFLFLLTKLAYAQLPESQLLVKALASDYELNFCGERVPLEDHDVRQRFEKQLMLMLQDPAQIILWIKRSGRYFPHIETTLLKHNMPDDLKYIAIIESALRPHATSKSNAVGFWQFTASSGKKYGLELSSKIDERRNVFASTEAAIRYFRELYRDYRSWTLCAAAYNMGENGLETEILMQEVNDFYKLYLPLETQQYPLRAVCAKLVLTNLKYFGFDFDAIDVYPELQVDRVEIELDERIPLTLIAEAAGTYFKRIKDMNPEIRGYYLVAGSREILIPVGAGQRFASNLRRLLQNSHKRRKTIYYIVQTGDNLTVIAEQFNVSVGALLIWNKLNVNAILHPGDKIVIYQKRNE